MIIHECQQGSQKWLDLRAGIPTASEFDKIVTPGGAPSKSAPAYCNKLLVEVMLGRPLLGVLTPIMARGNQMEAEAVKYYELMKDTETVKVGFITTDDGRAGASPDRFVGETGLLEVKCPTDETHSKYLAAHIDALLGEDKGVAETYKVQCQAQLWIAERDFSDVISYYPGLPEAITCIGRDEKFIALMKAELNKFIDMFDKRLEKLRALGYLDGVVVSKSAKQPEDCGAFGISESDIEDYLRVLQQKGVPA